MLESGAGRRALRRHGVHGRRAAQHGPYRRHHRLHGSHRRRAPGGGRAGAARGLPDQSGVAQQPLRRGGRAYGDDSGLSERRRTARPPSAQRWRESRRSSRTRSALAGQSPVADGSIDGGPWEPLPALLGSNPSALTAAGLNSHWRAEGVARTCKIGHDGDPNPAALSDAADIGEDGGSSPIRSIKNCGSRRRGPARRGS